MDSFETIAGIGDSIGGMAGSGVGVWGDMTGMEVDNLEKESLEKEAKLTQWNGQTCDDTELLCRESRSCCGYAIVPATGHEKRQCMDLGKDGSFKKVDGDFTMFACKKD